MLLYAVGALSVYVLLYILLWTYRKERQLKDLWKEEREGQTRVRLGWQRRADGQWRNLSFWMPTEQLRNELKLAKNVKVSAKRA